ncbi:conserved Plasmodium protein, unknown function [Plasmodium vinckei brucechwatti]|uniref:Uncharacterized protein n=1 Tax=Plasmodium vinckei brucechwatti TaxID=119398 RepID=A0A6V7RWK3_PLAVN|nr:conserved Plasmodium protein, unknown function [Plasmodium vinckei brucechwatti]
MMQFIRNIRREFVICGMGRNGLVGSITNKRYSTKITTDIENDIIKNLVNMDSKNISYGIKKCVKNCFINKKMFNIYTDLVKKHSSNFEFQDIVLILQSYALCKERNFQVYSILSNRALYIFKENKIEYNKLTYDNIYRYILASNNLNYTDYELMTIFLKIIKKNLNIFGMKKISNILHALVKLKIIDDELLDICYFYILEHFDEMKYNYINHILSAYSKKTNIAYSELYYKLIKYVYENIKLMDSISIYNTVIQIKNILDVLKRDKIYQAYFPNDNYANDLGKNILTKIDRTKDRPGVERVDKKNDTHTNDTEYLESVLSKDNEKQKGEGNDNFCYINDEAKKMEEDKKKNNCEDYNKKVLNNIVPLLFYKVNSCLAFLSLNQLIKLLCAYKELNYFNYVYIYNRLLHFLLSKVKTSKINFEERILILEFFTVLPYVDNNMEEIINLVIDNIENVLIFDYVYLCRLLACCKHLQIHNDNILSKIDLLIFKNKKKFENYTNLNDLQLFLQFYNKNYQEWEETVKFLNSLVEEKKNTNKIEQEDNTNSNIASLPINNEIQKVITYKYNKIEKRFNEDTLNVIDHTKSIMSPEKEISTDNPSDANSPKNKDDISKNISQYLYFNLMNEKK